MHFSAAHSVPQRLGIDIARVVTAEGVVRQLINLNEGAFLRGCRTCSQTSDIYMTGQSGQGAAPHTT
jgi:hypothetical protein